MHFWFLDEYFKRFSQRVMSRKKLLGIFLSYKLALCCFLQVHGALAVCRVPVRPVAVWSASPDVRGHHQRVTPDHCRHWESTGRCCLVLVPCNAAELFFIIKFINNVDSTKIIFVLLNLITINVFGLKSPNNNLTIKNF